MVIVAAAAITAAGVGAYHGGKAVVEDVGKKLRRSTTQRTRNQERRVQSTEEQLQREQENAIKQHLSINDRVNKFKRNVPEQRNKTGMGLFRKSN
jgi:hypothetical protein